MKILAVETPSGPARAHLEVAVEPRGALVLGHGAGGGVEAPDLLAATKAARSEGFSVALVEQPYRRRVTRPEDPVDLGFALVDPLDAAVQRVEEGVRRVEEVDCRCAVMHRHDQARANRPNELSRRRTA